MIPSIETFTANWYVLRKGAAHDDEDNDDTPTIAFLDCGFTNFGHAWAIELRRRNLLNCHWYLRLNP
jgi:hypothetical protein